MTAARSCRVLWVIIRTWVFTWTEPGPLEEGDRSREMTCCNFIFHSITCVFIARAAVTKSHSPGDLNHRDVLSHSFGGQKSEIKVSS